MLNSPEYSEEYEQSRKEEEQSLASTEQEAPAVTFPRGYILGVFISLEDAKRAEEALNAAGFDEQEIHVLEGHDFMEAISQDHSPLNIITSIAHDEYLVEMQRGRSFLAIRPANLAQLEPIRDLMAPYGAYLVKYHDTWSQRELLP